MNVAPEIIAALCRKHAPDLLTPVKWQGTPLDKVRLLWGISGVESSFGLNCSPRHEPAYCYGGRYFNPVASREWGCLAHCSFGPWQVMFANFPYGVSPLSLIWETDLLAWWNKCAESRHRERGAESLGHRDRLQRT